MGLLPTNNIHDFPILKLEFSGMKLAIMRAITEHNDEIEKMIQLALDGATENLDQFIKAEIDRVLRTTVAESMRRYFSYGDGWAVIDAAIKNALNEVMDKHGKR